MLRDSEANQQIIKKLTEEMELNKANISKKDHENSVLTKKLDELREELDGLKLSAIETGLNVASTVGRLKSDNNDLLKQIANKSVESEIKCSKALRESQSKELRIKSLETENALTKTELGKSKQENILLIEEIEELKEEIEKLNERELHFNLPLVCKKGSRFNFCSGNTEKCKLCEEAFTDHSTTACTPKKPITNEEKITWIELEFDHWVKIKRHQQRKLWSSKCLKKCCNLETTAVRSSKRK